MSSSRYQNIVTSFMHLPLWVRLWLTLVLVPVNLASLCFLNTHIGMATAIAAAITFSLNGFLIWQNQGFSKVLAIPHLITWIPLQVYLSIALLLTDQWQTNPDFPFYYSWILFIINGTSLGFDVVDSSAWYTGNRDIAGHSDRIPWL